MIDRNLEYIGRWIACIPTRVGIGMVVVFCVGTVLLLAFMGVKRGWRWSAGLALLEYLFLHPIGSIAAEGPGLSGISTDSLCELSLSWGCDWTFFGSGHCECACVCPCGPVAGLRFRADEVVEGAAGRRWLFGADRAAAVLFQTGFRGI